jgi:glycosyltransferase involved in cell wall biosynthesis
MIGDSKRIRVLPFHGELNADDFDPLTLPPVDIQRYDFTYIASGEPHKNHINLIKAWCILADEGIYPSLCLTISSSHFPELCHSIDHLIESRNLLIFNKGTLTYSEVHSLYKRSNATIYPSKLESLGLPLIEARDAGLPIIASELDYVRDIIKPEQTFDPESPISIARAVKRHLDLIETPQTIMNADEFLRAIWN